MHTVAAAACRTVPALRLAAGHKRRVAYERARLMGPGGTFTFSNLSMFGIEQLMRMRGSSEVAGVRAWGQQVRSDVAGHQAWGKQVPSEVAGPGFGVSRCRPR